MMRVNRASLAVKPIRIRIRITLTLLLLVFCPSAFALSSLSEGYASDQVSQNMTDLERIYRFVDANFLYDIDHKKVYEAMAHAMLDALGDQWTTYIDSSQSEEYEEMITGRYTGVGISLLKTPAQNQKDDDDRTLYVQVTGVFKGSPAERAGLAIGDLILQIDGQDVREKSAVECSRMLRGERGSKVSVSVQRAGFRFDAEMVRDEISAPTVESQMLDGGIFYIRINQFTQDTERQVADQFRGVERVSGVILDLRGNGGGDVNSSLGVANLFLDGGSVIISVSGKAKSRNRVHYASSGTIIPLQANMTVLVDGGTASAAEILALALRDNTRAVLIGEKTFGKGVMQYASQYKDGVVNVTTAEYVSGSGVKVNRVGIEPDIVVSQNDMTEQEIESLIEAHKSGAAHEFVLANREFSFQSLDEGIEQLSRRFSAPRRALASLLLIEYKAISQEANSAVAFPQYDPALQTAINLLEKSWQSQASVFDMLSDAPDDEAAV